MRLKGLNNRDFKNDKKIDFLFPIGSTEQHGPFIPFGTDTFITDYLVDKIEQEFPEIVILPTLEVSRSQEHRGFFGTLWLTEETLERVMYDVCNSIKDRARRIFIYSFHANGIHIRRFIEKYSFKGINIINLEESNVEDCKYIEDVILKGSLDGHAGNSEISNMLYIQEGLVTIPSADYPKYNPGDAFATDNIAEICVDGISDPHPLWITDKKIGKEILDIYTKRIIENILLANDDSSTF